MNSVFNISEQDILDLVEKLLQVFKQIMAWLGILVLPEEGEYDGYPTTTSSEDGE